jgi:sigma-B regulation protein RsbU (phosphoserine phosphatase)
MRQLSDEFLREQLVDRKERLQRGILIISDSGPLLRLLDEVDAALDRMSSGTYGLCEVCGDAVERDRLTADPLMTRCLDHLTAVQQRALEQDLELAWQIQGGLLPPKSMRVHPWEICYEYQPAGSVSGDYCDVITHGDGGIHFLLGDVSGKGIAASMLMSHLHAMFRTLITANTPFGELMDRANRLFCESTTSGMYATLVLGKAAESGDVEMCNAGHCAPLHVSRVGLNAVEATGIPLGLLCGSGYTTRRIHLEPGEHIVLYTDGLNETRNELGEEYGNERIAGLLSTGQRGAAATLQACVADVDAFRAGHDRHDDLTVMVVGRIAE